MGGFQDHFSGHAALYADFRPHYPADLYSAIAGAAPGLNAAWDCGCGNGQASVGLADHFARVFATDASAEQIAAATAHPKISYHAAPAEASGLAAHSVDAVLIAQALHWFDFAQFYAEVRRVARPGAVVIAVAYELAEISTEIDALVRHFYNADIGPFWPADRAHIETGYRHIPWDFEPIEFPAIDMAARWNAAQFVGYTKTWSAVQRHRAATGADVIPAFAAALTALWGAEPRTVRWPLVVLAGRV